MMLPALAALLQAATFNPPLDRPIAYTVSEVRDDGASVQRVAVDRRVTFRRREGGFRAEVETLKTHAASDAKPARMLQAAMAAMIGRRVVILLDANGAVIDVENRAVVWAAQVDALASTFAGSKAGERAATAEALMAPLRAMSVEQQRSRIGDMISPLIGSDLVTQGARPTRAVSIATLGREGTEAILTGSEATVRAADGALVFERSLTGADKRVRQQRIVDPASGLVRVFTDVTETDLGPAHLKVTRSTVISP